MVTTSWSESQAYTDVTITALVDSFDVGQSLTATAYLTTGIGPGTTVADEIAAAEFSVPVDLPVCSMASCGAFVTLFSGLSLGPGDYFLTMGPPTGGGTVGWFPALNPTVIVDAGVIQGPCLAASTAAPFAPASAFGPSGLCGPNDVMNFTVTGTAATPVPEPAAATLIGLGSLFLILAKGKSSRAADTLRKTGISSTLLRARNL
ncbi:MAG: hypothetical protein JO323_08025 [Acidobacteriia bacterium]|nr:hypothetical protein [Terriglobia bacterium]